MLRRRRGEGEQPKAPLSPKKKLLRIFLGLVLLFIVLLGAGAAWAYTLPMPKPHPTPQATLVYGDNGQVIGHFSEQDRVDVPLSAVPQVVINAVVSTEDRHFWSEGAINPLSTVRAFMADVSGSGGLQGGSTITQQYVKQAYLSPKRTITRKIEEAVIAYRLAQSQPKKRILDEYLNTIYWGRGAYGVQAAAQAFFGKNVQQLDLPEAALLAGIIKDPGGADPAYDPRLARIYQEGALKSMVRDKKITAAQAAAAAATPFSAYVIAPSSSGSTAARAAGEDYFLAAVRAQLYQAYGKQMVDGGGLRVYTSLDPKLQAAAYNAVYGKGPHALDPLKGGPSGAMVTMDDHGHVLALVGGQNYGKSSVDLALGAAGGGSGRQAGSTFKAFMLADLIHQGYSVQSQIPAPPKISIPNGNGPGQAWNVSNYEGEALAPKMSVVDATAFSINTVYAQVVQALGANMLDGMAENMGIKKSELAHPYLSQVLGTAAVSPMEMTAGYATLAANGTYHAPILITKVVDAAGHALPLPVKPSSHPVLTGHQAAVEDYVLQQVVARGTGVAAGGIGSDVAGKTGTTENSYDAWFIGYTPKITTAMWMGDASGEKSMDGFRGLASVTGGSIPAEIWHDYMAAAISAEPQLGGSFPAPGSLAGKNLTVGKPPATTTTTSTSTVPRSSTTSQAPASTTTAPPAPQPQPTLPTVPSTTTTVPPPTTTTTTPPSTTTTTVAGGGSPNAAPGSSTTTTPASGGSG